MTQIDLISVDNDNARKVCEQIENQTYPTYSHLKKDLNERLGGLDDVMVFTISQFMDEVNDQLLDNLTEYFISYVKIDKNNLVD